jgi:hypothetical protein
VHLSKVIRKPSRVAKGMADDVKKLIATQDGSPESGRPRRDN